MRIHLPEVPELFPLSSSCVHVVTIRFQHLSAINFFTAKATGVGDHVNCSRLLANLFPYDDVTSIPNESFVAFSTMEDNDKYDGVEGALVNSKAGPYQVE